MPAWHFAAAGARQRSRGGEGGCSQEWNRFKISLLTLCLWLQLHGHKGTFQARCLGSLAPRSVVQWAPRWLAFQSGSVFAFINVVLEAAFQLTSKRK